MQVETEIRDAVKSGSIPIQEADILLEALLADAQNVQEPGLGRVIQSGELPMIVGNLASAGYVKVWKVPGDHPDANVMSIINRNSLDQTLKKRLPNGERAFTVYEPEEKPFRGNLKCPLHVESPDRELYAQMGLPTCPKSNLRTRYQVRRHMRNRHPEELEAIQFELQGEE